MQKSSIHIEVLLDEGRIPSEISWSASDTTADQVKRANAMMLAFWDGVDKTSLRIDLWTKEMMVDEMADFFYQTLMTMADTFQRATQQSELVSDLKKFAGEFQHRFRELESKNNKA
jgi:gliding motility-associated protein GldC